MPLFKRMKKTIIDPIKEQFVDSAQKFSEADSKYKGVERVVAKANAAIGGLTSPMAPIVKPLQEGVEKGMAAIDNTGKAIAQKIGDTLSPEQKEALRTKLAPRFEGEGADKVAGVLQKIMESPYTEAGINAVSAIIGAKASGGSAPKTIVKPRGFTVSKIVTPSNIFKSKPTYNQYARGTAFGERNIVQAVNDAKWAEGAAAESTKIFNNKRFVKNLDDSYNKIKSEIRDPFYTQFGKDAKLVQEALKRSPQYKKLLIDGDVVWNTKTKRFEDVPTSYAELERMGETGW